MRKFLKYALIVVAVIILLGILRGGKKPADNEQPPVSGNERPAQTSEATAPEADSVKEKSPSSKPADSPLSASKGEIIIGFEYVLPGLGQPFSALGISGVKFYPDAISWGKMQKSKSAPIDFALLDRMVAEYQANGFRDVVIALKPHSLWASKNILSNPAPKEENLPLYEAWVKAIVERYDADGMDDMAGLKYSVVYYEVGTEFSSYEPEPVGEYLTVLASAYRAAHGAYSNVKIGHAAFLTTTVFEKHPSPSGYEAAFTAASERIMEHSLSDIRAVLDRSDIFDFVNFHSLGDPYEIEDIAAWLRYEMEKRGYKKPLVVSDTALTPFIGWGQATDCKKAARGIIVTPAKESDRCRLAEYFKKLINEDPATLAWVRSYVAADTVKRVIVAAEQGIALIDTAFSEDLEAAKKLLQAGGGNSAWGGMAKTKANVLTQERTVTGYYPSFYALKQFIGHIKGYTTVKRISGSDPGIRAYEFIKGGKPVRILWYEPAQLVLPGDPVPTKEFSLSVASSRASVEPLVQKEGETKGTSKTVAAQNGKINLTLTPTPVFVTEN